MRMSALRSTSRDLDAPRLADDRHLDLAGVVSCCSIARAMSRQIFGGVGVGRLRGVGDDAHLAAGLDRVGLLDAGEAAGHRLQLLQPLDVLLQRLAAGARAGWR